MYTTYLHIVSVRPKNDRLFLDNRQQNAQSDLTSMSSEIYCPEGDELHKLLLINFCQLAC